MVDPASLSRDPRPQAAPRAPGAALLAAAVAVAAGLALAGHVAVGVSAPLWLDEAWTGGLATAPSLPELVRNVRDDPNAPAFYLLIWAWAKLFGTSDVALHGPGIVLGCAAPLAAWLGLRASRPRVALVWAAAVGLWGPGIVQSGYARCYPMLLLAAVLSCVALLRLLDAPTRGRAVAWAASGALVVLTHYHGALLVGLQGMAWVALHRRRALDHWPAVLVFAPVLAWIAWHLPRLAAFAPPEVAWYHRLAPGELPSAVSALAGLPLAWLPTAAAALLLVEWSARRGGAAGAPAARDGALLTVGGAAVAAALAFVALSCLRPVYSGRYLTGFAPGVLLLVSARVAAAARGRADLLAAAVGGYALLASTFWFGPPIAGERAFGFEAASAWLARAEPRRLAFLWDNPTTAAMAPHELDLAGGFFLRRAGYAVEVTPMKPPPGADMNGPLLAEADGRTALLWLYDTNIHDTTARAHPPRLAEGGLDCRDFGRAPFGVLACRPALGR